MQTPWSSLSDTTLVHRLATLITQERNATAELLACIGEVDARRLYLPAGHPSMFAYCVHQFHLCEQAAYKRIHAARAARRFPAILAAIADGRLHLSGVVLLAPHLTEATAEELLSAVAHKTKAQIEQLLAERFPRADVPSLIRALPTPAVAAPFTNELSPGRVELPIQPENSGALVQASTQDQTQAPARIAAPAPPPKVAPLSPQRFALQVTIEKGTREKLRHAQELLGHQIPSGDLAQVLDRVLDLAISQLEKRKFAATQKPRPRRSDDSASQSRHVPSEIKRAVWSRDAGRCTFVSDTGLRCSSRTRLEFDHVHESSRGGRATPGNIRLRCWAHNQYAAECTFGAGFMNAKRERSRRAVAEGPTTAERPANLLATVQ